MAETEIKKINGRTIADTTAREAAKDSIKYTEQTLTDAQKAQAISNIGAVAKSQGTANSGKFLSVGADGNVSADGSPAFRVTISKTNNMNVSDKTVAEIKSAYQSGRSVVADVDGLVLPLVSVTDDFAAFCALTPDDEMQRVGVMITSAGVALASDFFVGGNQGADNAGKILGIGDDGVVVPTAKPTFTLTDSDKTEIVGEVVADGIEVAEKDMPVQALAGATAPTTSTVGVVGQEYYVIVDKAVTEMYVCTSALIGSYTWDKVEFGGDYTLPTASSTTLGGVKPIAKTDAMTQGVGVDDEGALWTAAGGTWELINEITLTEAANNVLINTDANGQPFSLKAVKVECVIKTDTSDPFTFIKIRVNDAQVCNNTTNTQKGETIYFSFLAYAMGEDGIMSMRSSAVMGNNYNWEYKTEKMGYRYSLDYLQSTITKLNVVANDGGKAVGIAGTKIYVYGVKA